MMARLKYVFCKLTGDICKDLSDWVDSTKPEYDDTDRYYVRMSHSGGAAPMRTVLHYAENVN